jgi:hypothetical protein
MVIIRDGRRGYGHSTSTAPRASPGFLLPTSSLTIWPYTNLSDPRWVLGEKFILLRQDPETSLPQKIGIFTRMAGVHTPITAVYSRNRSRSNLTAFTRIWESTLRSSPIKKCLSLKPLGHLRLFHPKVRLNCRNIGRCSKISRRSEMKRISN